MKKVRWGILSTGWMADMFTEDLVLAENAEVVAVGSRSLEQAQAFAGRYSIPNAYGTYEELVADETVDIIYIATPHPMHADNTLLALNAGKAVLCEKPVTMNVPELEELVRVAKEKNLFFMEGMWTRFLPPVIQAKKWIDEGRIGDVRLVKAEFGFRSDADLTHRLFDKELGGGALLDTGIYPVSFAAHILGNEPEKIQSSAYIGESGVDEQFSILFDYGNGKMASLNGGLRVTLSNEAVIFGTKGRIQLPSFLNTTEATLFDDDGNVADRITDDRSFRGYKYEAEAVGNALLQGKTELSVISHSDSLAIMKLLDTIREQWGLTYASDLNK